MRKVLTLPYTKKLGIHQSDRKGFLLQMNDAIQNQNHINTFHASASYSLAETSSGYFLEKNFSEIADQTIPVLRTATIKYKRAATGTLYSSAKLVDDNIASVNQVLLAKKKVLVTIQVKLFNEEKELVLTGNFEWFVILPALALKP